jgi:hypothetical protein
MQTLASKPGNRFTHSRAKQFGNRLQVVPAKAIGVRSEA